MARFVFTPAQEAIFQKALAFYINEQQAVRSTPEIVASLVNTTMAELRVLLNPVIARLRNEVSLRQATIDALTAAEKTRLAADITAIDTFNLGS